MQKRIVLAATVLLAAVRPADARGQADSVSRPGWTLERTMREFAIALGSPSPGWFPRRGDWTWVRTIRYPDGSVHRNPHRFPAAQTDSALAPGGPVCWSFSSGDAAAVPSLVDQATHGTGRWRRVRGTRFVPSGDPANSPFFVEWRREDGRWVISSYGEAAPYEPHLAGRDASEGRPRPGALALPLPPEAKVAAGTPWFDRDEPITVNGQRVRRTGPAHRLQAGDVVRYATYDGVDLYVDPAVLYDPDFLWAPVDRAGTFQPYYRQSRFATGCETHPLLQRPEADLSHPSASVP